MPVRTIYVGFRWSPSQVCLVRKLYNIMSRAEKTGQERRLESRVINLDTILVDLEMANSSMI